MKRKTIELSKQQQKWLGVFLLSLSLSWGVAQLEINSVTDWSLKAVNAQILRPEEAAAIIYQELPYLPQENQYRSAETGEIDSEHTLMSRFIRYHKDFQRRSPQYSLDWKVTLADYLGVNRSIRESNYPGSTLQTNPLTQDIEVIRQLSRRQRQQLVDLLVKIYNPQSQATTNKPVPQEEQTEETSEVSTPSTPSLSEPGDAQLLAP
ncbi:hypothetical protein [Crocosphaera chwakensis]|uniref:Uncharacterized protein n=1 Tax=Crocosphaera chwakensis CCY0110 TaxID=391612 RepID=A3IVF3_9CHRO|nr:hypothetical protein [Crocosphaera chwakensis]EAZ89525.1 hypothetical protein CY0110_09151 [Crocosphaera chwakensis CCY0110]